MKRTTGFFQTSGGFFGRRSMAAGSLMAAAVLLAAASPFAAYAGDTAEDTETPDNVITIVHTNDIHGYYALSDTAIGFAKLKTLIEQENADLVLDAGDTFHGQAFATVEKGQSIAELMAAVGYDAMSPGNHDWSYGAEQLKELETISGAAILAANVTDADGEYFDSPYFTKEVELGNGETVKVGVLGVIDDSFYSSTLPQNVEGLTFEEESAAASKTAATLREEDGCDIVIALTHQSDPEGFVSGLSGVDAVIAGHEHILLDEEYTDSEQKEIPVVEAGAYFADAGVLKMEIDPETKTVVSYSETIYTPEDLTDVEEDSEVLAAASEIETRQEKVLDTKIGESDTAYEYSWEEIRVGEQPLGKMITSAYLEKTGADVAFENAGGIRAGIPEGTITYRDIISISPYGNLLVTKKLTGQQILDCLEYSINVGIECSEVYETQKKALEAGEDPMQYSWPDNSGSYLQFGGIELEYDLSAEEGSRITSAKIGGEDVDPEKEYTVATNSYVADDSRYSGMQEAEKLMDYGTCEQALIEYMLGGENGLTSSSDASES